MLELYVYQEQYFFFFFFNDTATTEIYTLSLHDALPISFSIGRCCPMLIPLRHENMEGRRWPVVTFALIALNLLIFLGTRSEEHTSELQSQSNLVCRLLLEKKKKQKRTNTISSHSSCSQL